MVMLYVCYLWCRGAPMRSSVGHSGSSVSSLAPRRDTAFDESNLSNPKENGNGRSIESSAGGSVENAAKGPQTHAGAGAISAFDAFDTLASSR